MTFRDDSIRRAAGLRQVRPLLMLTLFAVGVMMAACGSTPPDVEEDTPTPTAASASGAATPETPAPTPVSDGLAAFAEVPGIVDHTNQGWPRQVDGLNGRITIHRQPQRIHTTSVGFDEITAGLVPVDRFAAVGNAAKNPDYSNVAEILADVPGIGRDPEEITSVEADLVVASPNRDADFIRALESVEITVVQIDLTPGPEGRIQTILLLGYIYGEEERALELAAEVRARTDFVADVVASLDGTPDSAPTVMYTAKYSDNITTSGGGTTAEAITLAAGGVCAPCAAGLTGHPRIGLESIIEIDPDVIILAMPPDEGAAYLDELLTTPALAAVTAVRQQQVYLLPSRFHTTLSYENVRGIEQLAAVLWRGHFPDEFRDSPPPFTLPATRE